MLRILRGQVFVDLVVSRHRLANFCLGILIPVMLATVANKHATLCFDLLDLSVPRYRRNSPVHWIRVKIVICTVAFEVAAAFSEAPHPPPPFHSEIAISCLSLGTNVFSEASSTIKRYASRIIA